MRIKSMLCHISENKAVVKVTGWINDKKVGSSLAEGSTVEIAEDKAISRLKNRLNIKNNNQINTKIKGDSKLKQQINVEVTKKEKVENINKNEEPSDWSNELTSIDSEIERLKWSRNEEIKFLEENLGINNRNKITKYKDLIYYLSLLKKINNSDSSNNNKLNIETLIKESDIILKELSWDNEQGRDYLQKEFNVSKRIDLDINQMISFLGKLKSIRNQSFTN
tara:strand:- start:446 stop:1114 length:669 start_codon:yes stop_codon:yes gene_type:complete